MGKLFQSFIVPYYKTQKVAIRLVCNLGFRDHTSSSFKSLKVLKFTDIVKFKLQLLMFNAWNVKLPVNIQRLFMVNKENKYPSRKCFDFKVKYFKSKIKSICISILGEYVR